MQVINKGWKIGVVIPWFGKNQKGGAEQQAWQIASRLKQAGCEVSALSTCSQSFLHSWHTNHFKPGIYHEDGIKIHRFPVRKRKAKRFNRVVGKLLSTKKEELKPGFSPVSSEDEHIYWHENINSPELISYLSEQQDNYDFFIFLPYLFPSSVEGIKAVGHKALLQACLHDECYAYLNQTMRSIYQCRALLFNSSGEFQLAKDIYGEWITGKSYIIGEGVEYTSSAAHYTPERPIPRRYLLYLGRKCHEKNTNLLVEQFDRYCRENPASSLSLVLAGPEQVALPEDNEKIIDLGLVASELKSFLLANSIALINPSVNESFSRVIFESWKEGRPIVVHKDCLATHQALIDSNHSGWAVASSQDFTNLFVRLENISPAQVEQLGARGKVFAKKMSDWDEVIKRYLVCFNSIASNRSRQNILLVISQTKISAADRADLDEFLQICLQGPWNIEILSRNEKLAADFHGHKRIKLSNLSSQDPEWDLIVWFGEENWDQGAEFISGHKCKIIRKHLGKQIFEDLTLSPERRLVGKNAKPAPIPCPRLFPPAMLQHYRGSAKKFETYNVLGINILLLADLSHANLPSLTKILQNLAGKYGVQVQLLIPDALNAVRSIKNMNSKNIHWKFFACSTGPMIPSQIYQVSDCLLWLEPVDTPTWFAIQACAYGLPVIKLSDEPGSDGFLTHKLGQAQEDHIAASIKLACQEGPVREKLQTVNEQVLKSYMPGRPHTQIHKTLMAFLAEDSVSQ